MVDSVLTGLVIKNVGDKTVKVSVKSVFSHPFYHKVINSYKSYMVHDEMNKCKKGQVVSFVLCKPFSSKKRWKLVY